MGRRTFDPQHPELQDLFDPSRLCAWLAEQLGGARAGQATPRRARVERCWPARGGLRFQWTYLLTARRGRHSLYAVPARAADRIEAPETAQWRDGEPSVRRYVEPIDMLVHTADCDAGLPQVATLLDADALRAFVADWLPDGASALRTSLLGYKPGRRAAVRIDARVGRSWRPLGVIKTIRTKARRDEATQQRSDGPTRSGAKGVRKPADAARPVASDLRVRRAFDIRRPVEGDWPPSPLACWHEALADQLRAATGGRVAVPRVLGEIPALNAVLIEWVEGRRLGAGATLGAGELHATAAALATFHQLEAPAGVPAFDRSRELTVLERWLDVLERVRPRKAARGRQLLEALAVASGPIDPQPPVLLHRDFYEKQLVWSEGCTTILDLDTLATGEAALDVGNLIAHAALYQMTRRRAPVTVADLHALADAVLRAYRSAGGHVADDAVWWYAASSLARGGALHGLRTLTRRVSPWLWDASEAVLKQLRASRAVHAAIK